MRLRLHARFFVLFGHSDTRVSPDVSSQGSLSKVSYVEASQLEARVVQRTLGKYAAPPVGVDQVGNLVLSLVLPTRLETWKSRVVYLDLFSLSWKEFPHLTTSEFVSEYTGYEPNIVWSGRKHLETHGYVDEPLDQVEPGSCFQSSDEGPSLMLFFVAELWVILRCHPSFPEFCALVTSSLDQDSGPWVVSKISHCGIAVSCSRCGDVILCSLVCSAEQNVFSGY